MENIHDTASVAKNLRLDRDRHVGETQILLLLCYGNIEKTTTITTKKNRTKQKNEQNPSAISKDQCLT